LFYVTGGGAWGRVRETVTFSNISSGGTPPITPATIASNSVSSDQFGWVVGGGIEGALWGNWTAKAEYLYMDLGRISSSFGGTIFSSSVSSGPFTVGTTSSIRDHIVRVGLNYLSLLRTPKCRESLEIFMPPRYRRGHDDDSFRPGFDPRLPRS
jgi:outer membrane immunogenic protein